jgi:hypothetical protein
MSEARTNSRPDLLSQHLADLAKSGLSEQTIAACQFHSVTREREAREILRWDRTAGKLLPALAIPFLDRQGNPTGFVRLKPDHPRKAKKSDGKERIIKYEQPKGVPLRIYVPPMAWPLIENPAQPLLFTEGEKKAAKAAQEGFACVGLCGVECWSLRREKGADGKPIGKRQLLPELTALPLAGRDAYIVFDSDAEQKQEVCRAESAFQRALQQAGARVSIVRLPAGEGGNKVGLDDYLCHHTAQELGWLLGPTEGAALDRLDKVLADEGAAGLFRDKKLLEDLAALSVDDPPQYARRRVSLRDAGVKMRDFDRAIRRLITEEIKKRPPDLVRGKTGGFFESDGYICRTKLTLDGPVTVPLCNFTATITDETIRDDGAERRVVLGISGHHCSGRPLPRVEVAAESFGRHDWVVPGWGSDAIVWPGEARALPAAIQALSENKQRRTVYTHSGWREISGGGHYLHAGGAIGPDGQAENVEVDLPETLAGFCLPPPLVPVGLRVGLAYGDLGRAAQTEAAALSEAIRASLAILDLASDRLTFPLLAAVYRAALGDSPGPIDFALHLAGPHGAGKSELAALAQQHFGDGLDARHLPGSWSSTANALEGLAFAAKDALLVVDDYAPRGAIGDRQRQERDADRLLRAQGNRAGRQRMRADGSLRSARPPRGLILSTGEDVPPGQSLRGRMLVLEVSPGDVPLAGLTPHQRAAGAGLYAQALAGFLHWLAPRYGELRTTLPDEYARLRLLALTGAGSSRTPGIVAGLALGLNLFLSFAFEASAITAAEREALTCRGWNALGQAGVAQAEQVGSVEPTALFLRLLAAAIGTTACVAGPDGREPAEQPEAWGWHQKTYGLGEQERTDWYPCRQGGRIGWVDGTDLYLEPEASYAAAQDLARHQGNELPVSARTLRKRLKERGLLASTDSEREVLTVRRTLEGKRREVLHLRTSLLWAEKPDQPDQHAPTTGPPGTCAGQVSEVDRTSAPDQASLDPVNPTNGNACPVGTNGHVVGLVGSNPGGDGGTGNPFHGQAGRRRGSL